MTAKPPYLNYREDFFGSNAGGSCGNIMQHIYGQAMPTETALNSLKGFSFTLVTFRDFNTNSGIDRILRVIQPLIVQHSFNHAKLTPAEEITSYSLDQESYQTKLLAEFY